MKFIQMLISVVTTWWELRNSPFPKEVKDFWYTGSYYSFVSDGIRGLGVELPCKQFMFNPFRMEMVGYPQRSYRIDGLIPAMRIGNKVGLYSLADRRSAYSSSMPDLATWDDGLKGNFRLEKIITVDENWHLEYHGGQDQHTTNVVGHIVTKEEYEPIRLSAELKEKIVSFTEQAPMPVEVKQIFQDSISEAFNLVDDVIVTVGNYLVIRYLKDKDWSKPVYGVWFLSHDADLVETMSKALFDDPEWATYMLPDEQNEKIVIVYYDKAQELKEALECQQAGQE